MAEVYAKKNENLESLIRRFKKKVDNEKILKEYKDRQYFIKPSVHRNEEKKKHKRANFLAKKLGTNKPSQDRWNKKRSLAPLFFILAYLIHHSSQRL